MVDEKIEQLREAAGSIEHSAGRVEDGINNVLEPEIKEARLSTHDAQQMVQLLARRVTILFSLSVLINLATVLFVVVNG